MLKLIFTLFLSSTFLISSSAYALDATKEGLISKAEERILSLGKQAQALELGTQGIQLCEEKKFEEAIDVMNKAILLKPDKTSFYFLRSTAYFGLGKFEKCLQDINQAIVRGPQNALFYYVRFLANFSLKNFNNAYNDIVLSASLGNDSAKEVIKILGNLSFPTYALNDAEKLDPNFYCERGSKLMNENKYGDAITDFDKAISLNPTNAHYYFQRGFAYLELGNPKQCLEDLNEAIALEPKNEQFYTGRAIAKRELGNQKEAIDDFITAAKLGHKFAQEKLKALEIAWE